MRRTVHTCDFLSTNPFVLVGLLSHVALKSCPTVVAKVRRIEDDLDGRGFECDLPLLQISSSPNQSRNCSHSGVLVHFALDESYKLVLRITLRSSIAARRSSLDADSKLTRQYKCSLGCCFSLTDLIGHHREQFDGHSENQVGHFRDRRTLTHVSVHSDE